MKETTRKKKEKYARAFPPGLLMLYRYSDDYNGHDYYVAFHKKNHVLMTFQFDRTSKNPVFIWENPQYIGSFKKL